MLVISQPRVKNQLCRCRRPESVGQSNTVEKLASFQVLLQFYKWNECPKLLSFYIAILNPEYQFIFTISQWCTADICRYENLESLGKCFVIP